MADGSSLVLGIVRYLAFAVLAVAGPGLALQRLARLRADPALVAPLGLVVCAAVYDLSLRLAHPWLFPVAIALLDAALLLPRGPWRTAPGPPLRGALAPFAVIVGLLSVTQYPFNRALRDGRVLIDSGEASDNAFYAGVAWELAAGYPPQAPGLAGIELGYHLGPHLVRGAQTRWAGTPPYDAISRFDNTLLALSLILALRAAARALGAPPLAVGLASWAPVATDFSFLYAFAAPGARWWSFLCGSNLLHSMFFARSTIPALLLALGALVAYARHRQGEGRGWLALASLLSLALPWFNVFLGSLMLAGLGTACLLCRERRALLVLLLPTSSVFAALLLQSRAAEAQIYLDPWEAVQTTQRLLDRPPLAGAGLFTGTALWLVAALGLRLLGLPAAIRALVSASPQAVALATMALLGWPLRLLVHINADGRFDESAYFAEHSGALLWLFTAIGVAPLLARAKPLALAVAVLAVVTLPSTAEFVVRKRALEPAVVPAPAVRAMRALAAASRPGGVVLLRPSTRLPPLPMVLAGRRVFFSEFIRNLLQFAPRDELKRRRELQRSFFREDDAGRALALARSMGAEYLYLPAGEGLRFDPRGVLERVFEERGERVYRLAPLAPAVKQAARGARGAGRAASGGRVPLACRDRQRRTAPSLRVRGVMSPALTTALGSIDPLDQCNRDWSLDRSRRLCHTGDVIDESINPELSEARGK
jgi:hypothetical protein